MTTPNIIIRGSYGDITVHEEGEMQVKIVGVLS